MNRLQYILVILWIAFSFDGFGQDCTTLYGSSQEPSNGLVYDLCTNATSVLIDASATSTSASGYTWSTAATTSAISVTAPGVYTVTVAVGGNPNACILNFTVNSVAPIIPALGNDTSLCTGDAFAISPSGTFLSYTWNDGTVADSFVVTGADTISLTVTDTNECIAEDTIIVTSYPIPSANLGPDTSKCTGDTITLFADTSMVSYFWGTGATTDSINVSSAGAYGVTVTDTNTCTNFEVINVFDYALPTPNLGVDQTLCVGSSVSISPGAGYIGYLWSENSTSASLTVNQIGSYSVTVTDTNTCQSSDTIEIFQFAPDSVSLGADTGLCIGDTIILDAGAQYASYAWSNFTGNQTLTVTLGNTYSVTVTDTNGCSTSDTVVIAANQLPLVSLGPNLEYCEGSSLSQVLDAGNGYQQYTWMDGITTQFNTITEQDTLVWVEVIDFNQCLNSDTLNVIENALPSVNIGGDDTICAGGSKSLNAGTGGGSFTAYAWSTAQTTQSIGVNTTGDYSVTITDNNNCNAADTMSLLVNPLPQPNLGADTGFCDGNAFTITLDPGTFDQYLWNNATTTPTQTINFPGYGTYAVTVTDLNGCSASDNLTIFQYPLPNPQLGNDTSYCEGDVFNLVLTPGGFDQYLWSDNTANQVLLVTNSGNYGVTVTDGNGCQSTDQIVVTENPAPNINLGQNLVFCEGDFINELFDAGATAGPGNSFLWSNGSVNQTIVVSNPGSYAVTVTNTTTMCQDSDRVEVRYFPLADADLGSDLIICPNEVLTLSPNVGFDGYNYNWSNGSVSTSIQVFSPGTYWVELNANNGTCSGISDTITITQGVQPVIELGGNFSMCAGQEVVFNNDRSPQPGVEYLWQDGTESYEYRINESGLFTLTATNKCGSVVDNVRIIFENCYNVWVPNTFTPNGDGKNEFFKADSDQEFFEFNMWIFDRYGTVVWKTNNPFQAWDGTINGADAPTGVYVWKMDYISAFDRSRTRHEKRGKVHLIR